MENKQLYHQRSKSKISVQSGILLIINMVFIFLLLGSYLSVYISPSQFWIIAFLGLAYPLFLVINVFFVLFWLVFLKRHFIWSAIVILLGFSHFNATFRFRNDSGKEKAANSVRVMSYNVRLFDLYNWNSKKEQNNTHLEVMHLFRNVKPDILCLQEYYKGNPKRILYADSISEINGLKYYSVELIDKGVKMLPFGLATFSRYPIINSFKQEFDNSYINYCLVTDVAANGDTFRVINTHLESIKFGKEDYVFVDGIASRNPSKKDLSLSSRIILVKMARAYRKRGSQANELAGLIRQSPHPVILCGDFNDTPVSYTYRQAAGLLTDAFVKAGIGFGQTYRNHLPFLRIDYIFADKMLKCNYFSTIKDHYSDHFPIYADLEPLKNQ